MAHRLAISGYGRVGQCVLRALYEGGYREHARVVAVNDLSSADTVCYLTRYDTTHGRFPGRVSCAGGVMQVNGDAIEILQEPDPARLPWDELGVDLVLECTGVLRDRDAAAVHLAAGAGRVLISNPADAGVDATVVYGVNDHTLAPAHRVVSNASCSTNCVVPVLQVLDQGLGIEHGVITTVHSAMNDQPAVDTSHHPDLRRSRSALHSIIPVDTALARGIERLIPGLAGRFEAVAMRVPTINVSVIDLTVQVRAAASPEEVNRLLRAAAGERFQGVLGYTEEPLASCDFNHDPRSAIVDGSQTRVSGEHLVKVLCWFDNEWGFANRMLDTSLAWLRAVETAGAERPGGG
jgi:erythrose-4-phosphate dehydrogenase